jgi:hypothetical protein
MVSTSDFMRASRSGPVPEQWHLARKLTLLALLVTAAAIALVLLLRRYGGISPLLFNFLADGSIGLLTGFGCRLVLRRRNEFIRGLCSAALSILGLAFLGYLTNWGSGIGPIELRMVDVHWLDRFHLALQLPLRLGRHTMDLVDLGHMFIAVDTSWLALRVWRKRRRSPAKTAGPLFSASNEGMQSERSSLLAVQPPAAQRVRPRVASGGSLPVQSSRGRRPLIAVLHARPSPPASRSRRRQLTHRKPAVQLAAYAEHRCPYCLEDVKRNDGRGSVECPICHTLHHKDCWDITGTCQVPHLNA